MNASILILLIGAAPPGSDARVVSHSIPATMRPGASQIVTVVMENAGTVPWDSGGDWVFRNRGEGTWSSAYLVASPTVFPTGQIPFTFVLTAPATGPFNVRGRMQARGQGYFGEILDVVVEVDARGPQPDLAATLQTHTLPSTLAPGEKRYVEAVFRNDGAIAWSAVTTDFRRSGGAHFGWASAISPAVAPGDQHSFGFVIAAPASAGSYELRGQMFDRGLNAAFGDHLVHTITVAAGTPQLWWAEVANTVPTHQNSGIYPVTITVENTGSSAWVGGNYALVFNPVPRPAWGRITLPLGAGEIVAPGATRTFSFTLPIPTDAIATHYSWTMHELGPTGVGAFGPIALKEIGTGEPVVVQVALGSGEDERGHGCLLTSDQLVYCFGHNTDGQLGLGTRLEERVPAQVTAIDRVTQIDAGYNFSCALRSDGTVACWGWNEDFQIADPSAGDALLPRDIPGITTAVEIATGATFACARLADGSVSCWGDNSNRQLGRGGTDRIDSAVPTPVITLTGATQLALGERHACALRSSGDAVCWGDNDSGQLGVVGPIDRSTPVVVPGLPATTKLVAGVDHTCALLANGEVWCWGDNSTGQLGDNTTIDQFAPKRVFGVSGATALTAGDFFSCAVIAGGDARCWGDNLGGQIGDGTSGTPNRTNDDLNTFGVENHRLVPTPVVGLSGAVEIEAGKAGACTLQSDHTRRCWGTNVFGQLGLGTDRHALTATPMSGLPAVLEIAGSKAHLFGHACARVAGDDMYCWGENIYGQLGDGTTMPRAYPAPVPALSGLVADIAVGNDSTCAVLIDGTVSCWGRNYRGQLGDNSYVDHVLPAPVTGLTGAVTIDAGPEFYCTTHLDGVPRCWGFNFEEYIALGHMDQLVPVAIPAASGAVQIACGSDHICARLPDLTARCWGDNDRGQLGTGVLGDQPTPAQVVGLNNIVEISAGENHSCARTSSGEVWCWGDDNYAQLGPASTGDRDTPLRVTGVSNAIQHASGYNYVCAVNSSGQARCWGDNTMGQLGSGTISFTIRGPTLMPGVSGITFAGAVGGWTYVVDGSGAAFAVGWVGYGGIGLGADFNLRPTTPLATDF